MKINIKTENMHLIIIQILKWGSEQNVYKSNEKILEIVNKNMHRNWISPRLCGIACWHS